MPLAFVQCVVVVLLDVKEVLVRGHGWRLDDDAPRRVFVHFFEPRARVNTNTAPKVVANGQIESLWLFACVCLPDCGLTSSFF